MGPPRPNSVFSHEIDYVTLLKGILNLKGYQNFIIDSKVTAILLNGWIWPIGGVASGRVCACSLRSRLVMLGVCSLGGANPSNWSKSKQFQATMSTPLTSVATVAFVKCPDCI